MKEKIVRIIKKIFFLPPVATLMIAIPSFAFLIVALTRKLGIPALNYTAYILSAYALVISITGISKIVTLARNGVSEHPFMKWLLSVPVVEKMIHYIQFKKETSDKNDELRRYRMCGCMLFLINVALVGITILAVKKNAGFSYPGYLIYVMAMYAFYSVITAVMNLVKYRKYGSPILSAAKVINMSTALVSIFSLETAMLAQFGSESTEHFRVIMTALTGTGVSLIVVGMAVFMIVRSGVLIKRNTEDGK